MCRKERNKAGIGKLKNTTLLWNDGTLLSGLQCNVLASLVHFVLCKVIGGQKGGHNSSAGPVPKLLIFADNCCCIGEGMKVQSLNSIQKIVTLPVEEGETPSCSRSCSVYCSDFTHVHDSCYYRHCTCKLLKEVRSNSSVGVS